MSVHVHNIAVGVLHVRTEANQRGDAVFGQLLRWLRRRGGNDRVTGSSHLV